MGLCVMLVLRLIGISFLAICAFAGAFLLAYAAVLCGWIVYADYAGTLGNSDGSAASVALVWAPLGALAAGLVCAGSLIRLRLGQTRQRSPVQAARPPLVAAAPPDGPDAELDRRLADHAALLKQLQALATHGSDTAQTAGPIGRTKPLVTEQDDRRVA